MIEPSTRIIQMAVRQRVLQVRGLHSSDEPSSFGLKIKLGFLCHLDFY